MGPSAKKKTFLKILSSLIVLTTLNARLFAACLYGVGLIGAPMPALCRIIEAGCRLAVIYLNFFPLFTTRKVSTARNKILEDGIALLQIFLATTAIEILLCLGVFLLRIPVDAGTGILFSPASRTGALLFRVRYLLLAFLTELILFWNGIIRVYATSVQLGIKWRVVGIVCGMIPVAHLYALCRIIRITGDEVLCENEKYLLNRTRAETQFCHTRYPILLVHGVFFRDFRFFNYWGRIPAELKRNGAVLHYGHQQSAASVADCGEELAERIRRIVSETGCGKVNIIAHSKGGLDSRYAISACGAADLVASLTTINTPHRGCIFADYLLDKIPDRVCRRVAARYNAALSHFGDSAPDFLAAVNDLTASSCRYLNAGLPDSPQVYYRSVGSKMNRASGGRFPLNMVYPLVKHFDGDCDGLVSVDSMKWGNDFIFLSVPSGRGISHGDMIDLNRENIPGFDVREFYVNLVHNLKEMGF